MPINKNDVIPEVVKSYLYGLKRGGRNEVYETLLLMLLNDEFVNHLNKIIDKSLASKQKEKDKVVYKIYSSKEYEDIVNLICKSKYFLSNYKLHEIERKKIIAKNIISEIASKAVLDSTQSIAQTMFTHPKTRFPTIEHKLITTSHTPKIQLTFDENTPLKDITKYLKNILEIKNTPRKSKMTLGRGFRILDIANKINDGIIEYNPEKDHYKEIVIQRKLWEIYKEDVPIDAISKTLQRIKRIKKDINTIEDK